MVEPFTLVSRLTDSGWKQLEMSQRIVEESTCIVFPHKECVIGSRVGAGKSISLARRQRSEGRDRSSEIQITIMRRSTIETRIIWRGDRIYISKNRVKFADNNDR